MRYKEQRPVKHRALFFGISAVFKEKGTLFIHFVL